MLNNSDPSLHKRRKQQLQKMPLKQLEAPSKQKLFFFFLIVFAKLFPTKLKFHKDLNWYPVQNEKFYSWTLGGPSNSNISSHGFSHREKANLIQKNKRNKQTKKREINRKEILHRHPTNFTSASTLPAAKWRQSQELIL